MGEGGTKVQSLPNCLRLYFSANQIFAGWNNGIQNSWNHDAGA
jgi:hypothetical protein